VTEFNKISERRKMRKPHNIVITEPDMEGLRYLLDPVRRPLSKDQEHLDVLEQELDRAQILSAGEAPPELVTMNSRVRLKNLTTGKEMTYTLVFPKDADLTAGRISVLAPIGTAILGYRAGDVIAWSVPGGKRKFRIEEVLYQPEAANRSTRVFAAQSHQTDGHRRSVAT
jgi:regulator of nucleoside diphosphate kinase